MNKILLTFGILLCCTFAVQAQNYYEFTPLLKDAYKKAISLRFKEARTAVEQVKEQEPHNVLVYYVENYIDFLKIYIDEDYKEFQRLEANKEYRLKKLKTGDSSSPYHLYTLAEVRLHWAVARAKFEEYRTAMFEVRNAFLKLERNQKKFPNFIANKKSLGILHSVVGAVPPKYKWLVNLAGMNGSIEQGQAEIKEVVDYAQNHPDFIFEEETIVMYALLVLHLGNNSTEAWNIIRNNSLDPKSNPLICFAQASVAQHTGRTEDAIRILKKRPMGQEYHPYYFLDYMLGLAKLYRMDADAAFHLNKFAIHFSGRNYIKECYHKMAWQRLIQGDEEGYRSYMKKVLTKGKATIDGDKNAQKAALSGEIPQPTLLKARLLFDGGFYDRAEQVLHSTDANAFSEKKHQVEYHYRKGRILHAQSSYTAALEEYDYTIEKGRSLPQYFACRAALEAGIIKENQGDFKAAKTYYDICLSIYPSRYSTSLHGKAKAGLNRIQ